jgi:hypothetical protein
MKVDPRDALFIPYLLMLQCKNLPRSINNLIS